MPSATTGLACPPMMGIPGSIAFALPRVSGPRPIGMGKSLTQPKAASSGSSTMVSPLEILELFFPANIGHEPLGAVPDLGSSMNRAVEGLETVDLPLSSVLRVM